VPRKHSAAGRGSFVTHLLTLRTALGVDQSHERGPNGEHQQAMLQRVFAFM